MAGVEKRTVSLSPELAAYVDDLIVSGAYATASEVIRAGLRALQEREGAVERWLRDEVVPAAVAMQAEPERGIPADVAFERLRALHRRRIEARSGQ
jgi:antitoxin ParD1/3/4